MRYPEIPEGLVASYYINGLDTACILFDKNWKVVGAGVAWYSPKDLPEDFDAQKGEVIALGRAIKNYEAPVIRAMKWFPSPTWTSSFDARTETNLKRGEFVVTKRV